MNQLEINSIGNAELRPLGIPNQSAANGATTDTSFKDVLQGLVSQVDSLQKNADTSIRDLVAGQDTDVHNVVVKMEEASVAFDLMMEVRNKLLEAYQEIAKMQS